MNYPALAFQTSEFSREEVARRVAKTAGALVRNGIGNGDVFAVMLRNGPALIELMLAARDIGAFYVPLNWHFKGEEAGYILKDSGARLLIIDPEFNSTISDSVPDDVRLFDAPNWNKQVALAQPVAGSWNRLTAAIPYTSGTTGRPKGVRRSAPLPDGPVGSLESMRRMQTAAFGVDAASRCLISAPLYHTAPCSYVMHAARCGAWLRVEPQFDAEATLDGIARFSITHLYLVPTMFVRLLRLPDETRRRYDLSSVRFVASTGAACPPDVKRAMIDWWGEVIYESYASSELGYVTVISSAEALRKPGSAGRPLDGVSIRILDGNYRELPVGSIGTIYVRQTLSPPFTYINRPQERDAVEHDGFVTVGDIGWLDGDGYLFVTDRRNDLVISGGVNIYPAEIEMQLIAMPGVADCAVFGIPDPEFGQALVAAVQPVKGAAVSGDGIRAFLSPRLANFKIPKFIQIHDELPREDTGKIFKRRLRDEFLRTASVPG